MAIKEMKEHLKVNESAGSSMGRSQDITPTPQHSIEKDLQMQIMQLKATNQQVERERERGKRGWEEREGEEESIIKFLKYIVLYNVLFLLLIPVTCLFIKKPHTKFGSECK